MLVPNYGNNTEILKVLKISIIRKETTFTKNKTPTRQNLLMSESLWNRTKGISIAYKKKCTFYLPPHPPPSLITYRLK